MSRSPRSTSVRTRALAVTAAVGLIAGTLATSAGAAMAAPPAPEPAVQDAAAPLEGGRYIVVMKDEPVVAYDGGVAGIPATKPGKGKKFDARSAAAGKYRAYLTAKQDEALAEAEVDSTTYRYTEAISGFAAELTAAEATALAKDDAVLAVTKDELRQLDTNASPQFLGLTGEGTRPGTGKKGDAGVWAQLGGTDDTVNGAGAGTVVGIIDSGIWPENPSFSGDGFGPPEGWQGDCQTGESFDADDCNNKLIGANYFVAGFGPDSIADYETLSPRDADGHGTHTASTAAGNDGVQATVDGREFGEISGMAPEARIAAYKVCWDAAGGGGGCASSDSTAAINKAIRDGVDVLNFSISGTSNNYLDAVELSFMFAADAGIFVAASSGNSGPGASTTNHPSPWLTTVAASTHTIYEKTLVTGDGQRFIGSSITLPLPEQTPLVLSDAIGAEGVETDEALLCAAGSLDEAGAAGKIVVCDRGVYDRVAKSDEVRRAGGVGMVLVNPVPGSLDNDMHSVPTVHLDETQRPALRAYAATEGATGAIEDTNAGSDTEVPEVAGFSSRGPSRGAGGDILKPDISAPGVGVLAAYSPRAKDRNYDFLSGTSMSSPHIAGLGALLRDAHPDWSPMAIKSAMMTTARDHASDASNDVFAAGAGFVEPRSFLDPGLVYDADQDDWWAFLAGQGVTYNDGSPVSETSLDASDLNQASIAVGSLAGKQTVTRTVTNVTDKTSVYSAAVSGLGGVTATVTPAKFTIAPGQSQTFEVELSRTTAPFNTYTQGHLELTDQRGHSVRSPVAVRPVGAAVPAEVSTDDSGQATFEVTSGFTGTMSTAVKGLTPGTVTQQTATNTSGATFSPTDERNVRQAFTIPEGTTLTRMELRANDPVDDDLDMFVQDVTPGSPTEGRVVAQAASGAANERITTTALPAGDYLIHVQAWAVADNAPSTTFDVRTFTVPDADAGNFTMSPQSQEVEVAQQYTFTGQASGLDPALPYLGWVAFSEGDAEAGRSLVSVR